ncbi:MAG: antitermination protein NusB [Nocardioidaceae bacterium]|nr:antitermination protein NusB [Nocardioidaceae bacterium]
MSARSKARKRALDICFESELRGLRLDGTLAQRTDERAAEGTALNPYTARLVQGVLAHQAEIDALIEDYAVGWTLDRMPAIDRNLLRIGAFEILHVDDVPDEVAISEAVALARQLSTEESPRFVNGLLARVSQRQLHGQAHGQP